MIVTTALPPAETVIGVASGSLPIVPATILGTSAYMVGDIKAVWGRDVQTPCNLTATRGSSIQI